MLKVLKVAAEEVALALRFTKKLKSYLKTLTVNSTVKLNRLTNF
jgi:hypothetical protein